MCGRAVLLCDRAVLSEGAGRHAPTCRLVGAPAQTCQPGRVVDLCRVVGSVGSVALQRGVRSIGVVLRWSCGGPAVVLRWSRGVDRAPGPDPNHLMLTGSTGKELP